VKHRKHKLIWNINVKINSEAVIQHSS